MDIITLSLIGRKFGIPMDVLRFMLDFLYEKLNDDNIRKALLLWISDKNDALFRYGQISLWNTSNVTNMSCLFENVKQFEEDISKWNTKNVRDMKGMFLFSNKVTVDLSKWNLQNVTNISFMFSDSRKLNCGNISNWNIENVTNMDGTFSRTKKFYSLKFISKWNTSNVRSFRFCFYFCNIRKLNLKGWIIQNNADIEQMFKQGD